MKRFVLIRNADPTGLSGTGLVAEGIEFSDGTTVMRWRHNNAQPNIAPTTVVHPDVDNVEAVHCHGGLSRIAWVD